VVCKKLDMKDETSLTVPREKQRFGKRKKKQGILESTDARTEPRTSMRMSGVFATMGRLNVVPKRETIYCAG